MGVVICGAFVNGSFVTGVGVTGTFSEACVVAVLHVEFTMKMMGVVVENSAGDRWLG